MSPKSVVHLGGYADGVGTIAGSGVVIEIGGDRYFLVTAKHVSGSGILESKAIPETSTLIFEASRLADGNSLQVETVIEWDPSDWEEHPTDHVVRDDIAIVEITDQITAPVEAVNHVNMPRKSSATGLLHGTAPWPERGLKVTLVGYPSFFGTKHVAGGKPPPVSTSGKIASDSFSKPGTAPDVFTAEILSHAGMSGGGYFAEDADGIEYLMGIHLGFLSDTDDETPTGFTYFVPAYEIANWFVSKGILGPSFELL